WQLDDISIQVLPDFEMRMNYAYTSTTGTGEEFGRIPASQLPSVMNIGAEVLNYGGATQTNVAVECVVRDEDDNIVFSQTTNVGELTTGTSAISDDFVNLPFLDLGRYEATFSIVSDQLQFDEVLEDNSLTRNFEVTSDVYSIDALGNHPAGTEQRAQLGTGSFTDNPTLDVLSMYNIFAPTEALSATIIFGTNTRAGAAATIEVFMLDTADVLNQPSNVNSPIDGVGSDLRTIVQTDVTAGRVTIPFEQPISLQPGAYYVCARISGSGTTAATDAEVFIADDNTVPQPGATSMIYLPIDFNDDGTEGPHLYSNGNASAIRLNVTPTVGVEEQERTAMVSMFPNPTNGQLTIVSEDAGMMELEVIDMIGATVRTGNFNGRTTIDLTGLAAGVYTVRVGNGEQTNVERINLH
ncbi:MAG: T9SS type A sorting domain-containing protein, partial [Flavobacteriales bacterium]|nr:T9SS type A sorting domain-containing protein [Flavobacteriales bacterium]